MEENDVNTQAETSTDTGSSPSEETPAVETQTDNATQDNSGDETQAAGDKTVPYDRFKEVNDNFRQTQAELRAMREQQQQIAQGLQQQQLANNPQLQQQQQAEEQLMQMMEKVAPKLGFVRQEDVQKQQQMNEIRMEHERLANKFNGKDGLPKYNAQEVIDFAISMGMQNAKGLEHAYNMMHSAEITQAQINKAMQQSRGVQSERSNGTGSANAGVTDEDLKKAAMEGDQNATHLLLKRRLSSK